jgi:acetate kinase
VLEGSDILQGVEGSTPGRGVIPPQESTAPRATAGAVVAEASGLRFDRGVDRPFRVLCLNAGSSSLRLAVYAMQRRLEALLIEGSVEGIGTGSDRLRLRRAGGETVAERMQPFRDSATALHAALAALGEGVPETLASIDAVGHRIVHGGPSGHATRRVDRDLLEELRRRVPLAPLHLPGALEAIEVVGNRLPGLPQVACFDTAFHRRMPEIAQRLPLPDALWSEGIRRYGFHGLSFEFVVQELGSELAPRTVIAHLGSGSSLVALRDGVPIDTTMSFTPAGGVMMATRSGDLDPGVLLHLLRERGWDGARLERLVTHEAGLLGVSGVSGDMRTLLRLRAENPRAALAVAMFCHQVRKAIGALAAVLGGLDLLVFTGAIGEGSAEIREEICTGLDHLGLRGNKGRDRTGDAEIFPVEPHACEVRTVPTNENLMIARHTRAVVHSGEVGKGG